MLWFKHSSDARNSLKLRKVRRKYGADGYAIYWFCLEAIAQEVDKDNLTFNLKEDAETIGFELTIQEKRVEEIMEYMVEIGLFESSNGMITCMKLAERLDKSMTNSPRMRKWLAKKDGQALSVDVMTCADDVMTSGDSVSTCAELDKNRIEKNRIDNKNILSSKPDTKPAIKKSKHDDLVKSVFDQWVQVMNKSANTKLTKERKDKILDRCKNGYTFEDFKNAIYGCSITPHNMGANENGRLYNDIELICRTGTHLERFRDACKPVSPPQQYQSNPTRKKSLMERSHDDAQTALNIIERRAEQRQASHSHVHENGQLIRSQVADEGRLLSE